MYSKTLDRAASRLRKVTRLVSSSRNEAKKLLATA
jgi:hypothetical protein